MTFDARPTLRFSDLFRARAHSLERMYAPDALHLTYNARGAFFQLLRSMPAQKGKTVLLPAFHCTALVEPVARAGYAARFYRVRPDFSVDSADLREKLSSDVAAVVAIHYFGFPANMDAFLELASERDCYVVEDCAHSFLSKQADRYLGHSGHFSLFSYAKFAPSMFGGGLGINASAFSPQVSVNTLPFLSKMVMGKRMMEQVLRNSPNNPMSRMLLALEERRVAEKRAEPETASRSQFVDDPYLFQEDLALTGMPWISRRVIESGDWEEMRAARQRNYRLLAELLEESEILRRAFPDLPDDVCPWAFPVLFDDRTLHEHALQKIGVPFFTFGEVLHPLLSQSNDAARKDAEWLSRRLLLLPVHSQLSEADIKNIATLVNQYVRDATPSEQLRMRAQT